MNSTGASAHFWRTLIAAFFFIQFATAEDFVKTIFVRYSVPPFTSNEIKGLAEATYTFYENGTSFVEISKWEPLSRDMADDVRVGLPAFSARTGYLENPISVSKELLFSPLAVLQVHIDSETKQAQRLSLVKRSASAVTEQQQRDGRPSVELVFHAPAPVPAVNKPVVLSAEGKVQEPPPEKTFLQKYWWVLIAGVFVLVSSGGGGDGK